jgi:ZIP family zinc transporter
MGWHGVDPVRDASEEQLVSPAEQGLVASLLAGLATGLGGLPVLFGGRLPHRLFDGLVGFAAGVMLAVSAYEIAAGLVEERTLTLLAAAAGGLFVLGVRALSSLPHLSGVRWLGRGARVALVVTLHNLVEGLLVVATFARSGATVGLGVAIAIAAHNVPEGIAVAEPLRRAGVGGWRCVALAALSGLGEPLGALMAIVVLGPVLPPSMGGALAAGAMVALAAAELIPEAFSHTYVGEAAFGLLAGVVLAFGLLGGPG